MGPIHNAPLTPHFRHNFPIFDLVSIDSKNALIALSTEMCAVSRRDVVRGRHLTLSASFSGSPSCPLLICSDAMSM
jgi:hypothetical protein